MFCESISCYQPSGKLEGGWYISAFINAILSQLYESSGDAEHMVYTPFLPVLMVYQAVITIRSS